MNSVGEAACHDTTQSSTCSLPLRQALLLCRCGSLSMVAVALLGLILVGSRLVRARESLPDPMDTLAAANHLAMPVAENGTYTVTLPLVVRIYPCRPLSGIGIAGPAVGTAGQPQVFVATVQPANATRPIAYTWQASGQAPVVHSGALSDTVSFTWQVTGTQTVTVTATNDCDQVVTASHLIDLSSDPRGMIAFERQLSPGETHDIYVMYQDGTGLQNVTNYPGADDGAPTWSSDGMWIAFASDRLGNGNLAIFKIHLPTRQVQQLTDGTYSDRWPTWSPDGTRIAFMRETTSNGHPNGEIYVMNADGTGQYNLTNYEWGDDFPAWSRDGQWIAFTSERNWGGRDLWVTRPDGTDAHIVARTDFQEEKYPTWGPDGRIYYTFSPTSKADLLYRIWPDGSGMEQVFQDTYKRYIASWAPDQPCFVFYSFLGSAVKQIWKWCEGYSQAVNLTNSGAGVSNEFCAWSPVPLANVSE